MQTFFTVLITVLFVDLTIRWYLRPRPVRQDSPFHGFEFAGKRPPKGFIARLHTDFGDIDNTQLEATFGPAIMFKPMLATKAVRIDHITYYFNRRILCTFNRPIYLVAADEYTPLSCKVDDISCNLL